MTYNKAIVKKLKYMHFFTELKVQKVHKQPLKFWRKIECVKILFYEEYINKKYKLKSMFLGFFVVRFMLVVLGLTAL